MNEKYTINDGQHISPYTFLGESVGDDGTRVKAVVTEGEVIEFEAVSPEVEEAIKRSFGVA